MKFLETKDAMTGEAVQLHYMDYGQGKPIILIHGWPSSKQMWEYQVMPLVEAGHRVISYDRRGFGMSSKPWNGYDYDSLASDLSALIDQLNLTDVTLVGFSMGGGEVARYCSRYGCDKLSKVVLVSSVLPFMLKTDDNPDGADKDMFDEMVMQIKEDRMDFLENFGKKFFGVNLLSSPVSDAYLGYFAMLASVASPKATIDCIRSFSETDFRSDLSAITVPALVIHGTSDNIVPIELSSDKTADMLSDATYIKYDGAPHGLFFTEKERLVQDLLDFVGGGASTVREENMAETSAY